MNSQNRKQEQEKRWQAAVKRGAEILAPAGSFESMKAAVAAGADAVYIGGNSAPGPMQTIWTRTG